MPDNDSATRVLDRVKKRKPYHQSDVAGEANINPIIDLRVYELEIPDGGVEEYNFNVLTEALYDQVDEEGYDVGIFNEIVGHRCNEYMEIQQKNGI